jgi:predicted MFS family arabinose efflux permease
LSTTANRLSNAFATLWISETISLFGAQLSLLALPTLAILSLHASAVQVAILSALNSVPFMLFGLYAGVVADRSRRKGILIAANLVRAASLAVISVLGYVHVLTIAELYAAALVIGVATVFFDVSYQAYVPALVDPSQLIGANSRLQASASAAQVVGQPLAGALIQIVGAASTVLLNAGSYVASLLLLTSIRDREPPVARKPGRNVLAEIREGFAAVRNVDGLPVFISSSAIANVGHGLALPQMLVFLYGSLHAAPAFVGILSGVAGAGMLIGSLVSGRVERSMSLVTLLVAALAVVAASYAVIPLGALPVAGAAILAVSALVRAVALTIYNVNQLSYRQRNVPAELQGRVNATARTIVWGTLPLGNLAGGFIAARFGAGNAIAFAGAIAFVSAAPLLVFRPRRGAAAASGAAVSGEAL